MVRTDHGSSVPASSTSLGSLLPSLAQNPQFIPLQTAPKPDAPAKLAGSEFAPMDYFSSNCARCHGPNGSFYGATFGQKLTDDQLRQVVKDMCDGPGNSPLTGAHLDAEVAYHRSLVDKRPFLVLTHIEGIGSATINLAGEVTPEAEVKLLGGDQPIAAKVDDHSWTATLPGGTDLTKLQLIATKNNVQTVLNPAQVAYSHTEPIKLATP